MSVLGALVMLRFHYPSWYFYQHPIAFTQSPFAYMQPMTGEKFQIFVSIAKRWLLPWLLPVPAPGKADCKIAKFPGLPRQTAQGKTLENTRYSEVIMAIHINHFILVSEK